VPDYLGHAVHRTGEACFEALANDDAELFAELFPPYFVGILMVTERVRPRLTRYHAQQAVSWMAQPLMDLLDIGGYALIYSELHRKPELWQTAEKLFDRYCAPPEGADWLSLVAAMYRHQRTALGFTARSILRQGWQRSLSNQLSALERTAGSDVFDAGEVDHESALIRCIAPEGDLFDSVHFDASDVLVVRYLENLPVANGLDFGVTDWVARKLRALDDAGAKDETP
jgi:hypothetical protein